MINIEINSVVIDECKVKLGIFHPKFGELYIMDSYIKEHPEMFKETTYFKIVCAVCSSESRDDHFKYTKYEVVTFTENFKLYKYLKSTKRQINNHKFKFINFDFIKFGLDFPKVREIIYFHSKRITRSEKVSNIIPIKDSYILVDDDSSFYGNYTIDEKECALLSYGELNHEKYERYEPMSMKINLLKNLNRYDFPYASQPGDLYHVEDEEKLKLLNSLSYEERFNILQGKLESEIRRNEGGNHHKYYVRLAGNDDDSWTKYFFTKEQMIEELKYLHKMQPINKDEDIHKRDYVFTN